MNTETQNTAVTCEPHDFKDSEKKLEQLVAKHEDIFAQSPSVEQSVLLDKLNEALTWLRKCPEMPQGN
ncbi:hypothetical protein [Chitinophaga varians]|uniref:hypothetical protein n=1 Tax=Chitinophaga varians TaxID=2202339 RepID=UPI00165F93B2|nr:hypothetical protein [Chitinophaga varians]MBC9913143.1 hypothetical protein [Chitinophaga varians]